MRRMSMWVAAMLIAVQMFAAQTLDERAKAMKLGAPSGRQKTIAGGGTMRMYQNGAVYWSQKTGTVAVPAAFWKAYSEAGAERGALGLPVTEPLELADGGGRQMLFQRGAITVPRTGPPQTMTFSGVLFSADQLAIPAADVIAQQVQGPALLLGLRGPAGPRDVEVRCICGEAGTPRVRGCQIPEVSSTFPRVLVRCQQSRTCSTCFAQLIQQR